MKNTTNKPSPRYQFHVKTWGGFFNEGHQNVHGHLPGDYFFDTEEERSAYYEELKIMEAQLDARHLATTFTEGYCLQRTVCHRVTEWLGQTYYTTCDLGYGYEYSAACYWMNNKWYPGCNDYPLGEGFDYDANKVRVVSEWITGSFKIELPY